LFDVRAGDNHFSSTGAELNLPQLKGKLRITSELKPWPVTLASPGIMGWYGLVPFMECFHGIVSFGHSLSGELEVEGKSQSFEAGRGYIEKDWGRNFPSGYVWLHSNHLAGREDASLIAWTTYNKSQEVWLKIDDTHINWKVGGPAGELELRAERKRGGLLHAPLREAMHKRVEETLDAVVEVRHTKDGVTLLSATATTTGMEVFGDIERLLRI
jgi:hypothetical protein